MKGGLEKEGLAERSGLLALTQRFNFQGQF